MDRKQLQDKYRGCLLGLAIGDALGMPVETMTPQEILAATDGAGVTGFLAPLQKRFHSTKRLAPGQWTDDTQLSLAIARSLVRKRGFDLADIAAEHIVEYYGVRRGWGASTAIGIAELANRVRKPGEPVCNPRVHGMGNGVAMKVAPLALFYPQLTQSLLHSRVAAVASLTHRDSCAEVGALAVAIAVCSVLAQHEDLHDESWRLSKPFLPPIVTGAIAGIRCDVHGFDLHRTCERAMSGDDVYFVNTIATHTACDVRESVPFVLGSVRRAMTFRYGVLAAVNAGGDTDSNGAMVGAILGALYGASAIPREWVDGVEARDEIIRLADALLDLVQLDEAAGALSSW